MPDKAVPQPTEKELAILKVLWNRGASTVRQVNEEINRIQKTGYTTTLKIMQIMTDKELVARDESARTHVYRAKRPKQQTQKQLLGELLTLVFGGSTNQLVMQALEIGKLSNTELDEIRELLDGMEEGE